MGKTAAMPTPQTARDLRRLGFKLRKQEEAAAETRSELRRVIERAYHEEHAGPPAIGRLVGWNREYIWRIVAKTKGAGNGRARADA